MHYCVYFKQSNLQFSTYAAVAAAAAALAALHCHAICVSVSY